MAKYEQPEIECPCEYIIEGEIQLCEECPYIEDEEEREAANEQTPG